MIISRRRVLGVLLVAVAAITAIVLADVLQTVVFAITVAYVLYPLREQFVRRGLPDRIASAAATAFAFFLVVLLVVPVSFVLYRRRMVLIDALGQIPQTVPISVGEFELVVQVAPLVTSAQATIRQVAISASAAAPRLVLELVVFTFLVYGLLYRPGAVGTAVFRVIPPEYHDIPTRLHLRTRTTLYSIYVLQAATAAATFVLAFAVFSLLGYGSPLLLAVIAGILQFIPFVGPSVLVVTLAASDLLVGATTRAVMVLVLGLVVVSFVPDAVIRTQLADRTGEISPALYFIGFVGGILTVGPIGLIVGPVAVSLLIEVIDMLSECDDVLEVGTSSDPTEPPNSADPPEDVDGGSGSAG